MQFSKIILAYFVIGAVMFGGGAIQWDDAGVATMFVDTGDTISGNDALSGNFKNLGSTIRSVASLFAGGILVMWNLVAGLVGFIHWPIIVLVANNAPPSVTILLGGGFTVGFYMSVVGLILRGA